MLNIPRYDDLPVTKDGFRSAWGLFGEDDSVGLFSLITGEVIRHALSLARRGAVFSLNAPNDFLDPPLFSRPRLQRETQLVLEGRAINEVYNDFNPQSSSQWDALAHMAFDTDAFYNGATLQDVLERQRNTIEHWARRGIVGRGVLLDLERTARSAAGPRSGQQPRLHGRGPGSSPRRRRCGAAARRRVDPQDRVPALVLNTWP